MFLSSDLTTDHLTLVSRKKYKIVKLNYVFKRKALRPPNDLLVSVDPPTNLHFGKCCLYI